MIEALFPAKANALVTTAESTHNILKAIAAAEPAAWFPGIYAKSSGIPRDSLDEPLNSLRVAGLIRMTDWESGKGQGYFLTSEGQRALRLPPQHGAEVRKSSSQPSKPRIQAVTDDAAMTRLLIAAQVGMFAVGLVQALELGLPANGYLATGQAPIVAKLAVSRDMIANGGWWTLLSYALVHAGVLHLGCNLFGHYYDGALLERILGRVRFTSVYLISVLFGAVGALLSARSPVLLTVGSSGGLCGIFAAQFTYFALNRHLFLKNEWQTMVQHYLRVALLIAIISAVPGVSWGGHLGGAIGGLLTCALIGWPNSGKWYRAVSWTMTACLPLAGVAIVYWRVFN